MISQLLVKLAERRYDHGLDHAIHERYTRSLTAFQNHTKFLLPLIATTLVKKEMVKGIVRLRNSPVSQELWSNQRGRTFIRDPSKGDTVALRSDILTEAIRINRDTDSRTLLTVDFSHSRFVSQLTYPTRHAHRIGPSINL